MVLVLYDVGCTVLTYVSARFGPFTRDLRRRDFLLATLTQCILPYAPTPGFHSTLRATETPRLYHFVTRIHCISSHV